MLETTRRRHLSRFEAVEVDVVEVAREKVPGAARRIAVANLIAGQGQVRALNAVPQLDYWIRLGPSANKRSQQS